MNPADFGRRLPKKSSIFLFPLALTVSYDERVTILNRPLPGDATLVTG
jgi:hypothetical protein